MPWETGSPLSWCGQYGSQISQVLRPSSSASARSNIEVRNGHIASSAYAAVQPPRSNPPRRSSSGPPGPWYTPSRVTIIVAVSFMVSPSPRQSHQNGQRSAPASSAAYGCIEPTPCQMLSGQKAKCSAAIGMAAVRSRGGLATASSSVSGPSPTR